jgi:hypothetical protein
VLDFSEPSATHSRMCTTATPRAHAAYAALTLCILILASTANARRCAPSAQHATCITWLCHARKQGTFVLQHRGRAQMGKRGPTACGMDYICPPARSSCSSVRRATRKLCVRAAQSRPTRSRTTASSPRDDVRSRGRRVEAEHYFVMGDLSQQPRGSTARALAAAMT